MSKDPKRWRIRSARTIYENRWIRLREYEAIAPTGADAQYGLVHMRNRALGVLPIFENGDTLLVGQMRFASGRYSWELPEGGGELERTPLEGAQRELAEEAGLKAGRWLELLSDVELSNSVTDERACAFIAWDLEEDPTGARDASEDLALRRLPYGEALTMALSGDIADVFTLVMLLKADHLLRSGALPPDLAGLMQNRS